MRTETARFAITNHVNSRRLRLILRDVRQVGSDGAIMDRTVEPGQSVSFDTLASGLEIGVSADGLNEAEAAELHGGERINRFLPKGYADKLNTVAAAERHGGVPVTDLRVALSPNGPAPLSGVITDVREAIVELGLNITGAAFIAVRHGESADDALLRHANEQRMGRRAVDAPAPQADRDLGADMATAAMAASCASAAMSGVSVAIPEASGGGSYEESVERLAIKVADAILEQVAQRVPNASLAELHELTKIVSTLRG